MDEAGEADSRDVAGGRVHAVEVPDGLGGFREVVRQEPAAIIPVKGASVPPLVPCRPLPTCSSQMSKLAHVQ